MNKYVLTDEAKQDLIEIRKYLRSEVGARIAVSVARRFREAFTFLSGQPCACHSREDPTPESVKFWSVFSYLIVYNPVVYNPASKPLEIVRVLHGASDVTSILGNES